MSWSASHSFVFNIKAGSYIEKGKLKYKLSISKNYHSPVTYSIFSKKINFMGKGIIDIVDINNSDKKKGIVEIRGQNYNNYSLELTRAWADWAALIFSVYEARFITASSSNSSSK